MKPIPKLKRTEIMLNELFHLNSGIVKQFEPLAKKTTYKVGGIAELFYSPFHIEDVANAIRIANEHEFPIFILGGGSNILVNDGIISGLVIDTSTFLNNIQFNGEDVVVGGGTKLITLVRKSIENGLQGLENLSGIPGTVGGGIRMNCGAYGSEISEHIVSLVWVDFKGNIHHSTNNEISWGYRSAPQINKSCVTQVTFRLKQGDIVLLKDKMLEILSTRRKNHPLNFPSAGSVFKRPINGYASKLIDEAGLKGMRIGGAQVSEKHAGFIVNCSQAKAQEIYQLMIHIRQIVIEKFQLELELEQELWGF